MTRCSSGGRRSKAAARPDRRVAGRTAGPEHQRHSGPRDAAGVATPRKTRPGRRPQIRGLRCPAGHTQGRVGTGVGSAGGGF
jgi:hypothetical protein